MTREQKRVALIAGLVANPAFANYGSEKLIARADQVISDMDATDADTGTAEFTRISTALLAVQSALREEAREGEDPWETAVRIVRELKEARTERQGPRPSTERSDVLLARSRNDAILRSILPSAHVTAMDDGSWLIKHDGSQWTLKQTHAAEEKTA